MKYSLSRLLLEDIPGREIPFNITPSQEESENAYLLNVYTILKKGAEAAKDAITGKGMEVLYRIVDPDIQGIIDQARADAKRMSEEADAIVLDNTLCDQLVRDFDPSGGLPEAEKKVLSVCLGFLESAVPVRVYKWQPSSGQTPQEFEAQIRQGCQELKLAAAIKHIEDLETVIREANVELREAVEESTVEEVRRSLGDRGSSFNIDLTEDPKIKPIFKAATKAKRAFKRRIDTEGRTTVFWKPRITVLPPDASGVVRYAPCSANTTSQVFNEGSDRGWLRLLVERAADPLSPPSPGDPGAPTAPPESVSDATEQLYIRYPAARAIISDLASSGDDLSAAGLIAVLRRFSRAGNIVMSFPGESGSVSTTYLSSMQSAGINKVLAGIISYFVGTGLTSGRSRYVPNEVVYMVANAVGFSVTRPSEGQNTPIVDPYDVMRRLDRGARDGLTSLGRSAVEAIYFAIAAVAENAGVESRESRGGLEDAPSLSRFMQDASETVGEFYTMRSALGKMYPDDPRYKSGIVFDPGGEPDPAGVVTRLIRRMRGQPVRQRVTTQRVFPTFGERPEVARDFAPPPRGSARRAEQMKRAKENLTAIVKDMGVLSQNLRRATLILREEPSEQQGFLPPVKFSEMLSSMPRKMSLPQGMSGLGYETNALVASGESSPLDVWERLVSYSAGEAKSPPPGIDFSGENAFRDLSPYFNSNLSLALSHLKNFLVGQYISPLLRMSMHASFMYAERGLLTDEDLREINMKIKEAYTRAISGIDALNLSTPITVTIRSTRSGPVRRSTRTYKGIRVSMTPLHPLLISIVKPTADSPRASLAAVEAISPQITASDEAPTLFALQERGFTTPAPASPAAPDSPPDAPPDAPPTTPPTTAPPPVAAPTPAPTAPPTVTASPTAPDPAAAPTQPSPAAPQGGVTYSVDEEVKAMSRKPPTAKMPVAVDVDAGTVSVSMAADVRGGQSGAARLDSDLRVRGISDVRVSATGQASTRTLEADLSASLREGTLEEVAQSIGDALARHTADLSQLSPLPAVTGVRVSRLTPSTPTAPTTAGSGASGSDHDDDIPMGGH